jgi:hypothetical protein
MQGASNLLCQCVSDVWGPNHHDSIVGQDQVSTFARHPIYQLVNPNSAVFKSVWRPSVGAKLIVWNGYVANDGVQSHSGTICFQRKTTSVKWMTKNGVTCHVSFLLATRTFLYWMLRQDFKPAAILTFSAVWITSRGNLVRTGNTYHTIIYGIRRGGCTDSYERSQRCA